MLANHVEIYIERFCTKENFFFFLTLQNFQCSFLPGALHASIKIIWRFDTFSSSCLQTEIRRTGRFEMGELMYLRVFSSSVCSFSNYSQTCILYNSLPDLLSLLQGTAWPHFACSHTAIRVFMHVPMCVILHKYDHIIVAPFIL